MRRIGKLPGLIIWLVGLGFVAPIVLAEDHPEFSEEYLDDPAKIEKGKAIWAAQCALCHGAKAYPGKAPKLKPRRYKPDFAYKRITTGFKKMPGWKDVYDTDERMALVAWIMHKSFSP